MSCAKRSVVASSCFPSSGNAYSFSFLNLPLLSPVDHTSRQLKSPVHLARGGSPSSSERSPAPPRRSAFAAGSPH